MTSFILATSIAATTLLTIGNCYAQQTSITGSERFDSVSTEDISESEQLPRHTRQIDLEQIDPDNIRYFRPAHGHTFYEIKLEHGWCVFVAGNSGRIQCFEWKKNKE